MKPLALNWAEIPWLFPVTVSWMRESAKRNRLIRDKLDAEWANMYRVDLVQPAREPRRPKEPAFSAFLEGLSL